MKKLKPYKKMDKKIIKFDDTKIKKYKFYQQKSTISIENIDINKILVSNEVPLGKKDCKYFIGYKDAKIIKPLCIFFPKVTAYKRSFDKNKCMSFSEKYLKIWEKVSNNIKK